MEVIKRYQNGKLYSTSMSEYVVIEYLLDLVRMGKLGTFQVICNKTKDDITKDVLMQGLLKTNPTLENIESFIREN